MCDCTAAAAHHDKQQKCSATYTLSSTRPKRLKFGLIAGDCMCDCSAAAAHHDEQHTGSATPVAARMQLEATPLQGPACCAAVAIPLAVRLQGWSVSVHGGVGCKKLCRSCYRGLACQLVVSLGTRVSCQGTCPCCSVALSTVCTHSFVTQATVGSVLSHDQV